MGDNIFTRDIATWRPKTFNDENRSVRVIAVTENPVRVWDWERKDFVSEVLIVDGVHLPPSRQIPLLDSHDRSSVSRVLGSARNFRPAEKSLECDVFFSGTDSGKEAAQKVKEGHLTDFSVGYSSIESHWIPEGEVQSVNGRTFRGPVRITTKWNLKELSITPIGADQQATVRIWNGDAYAETPVSQSSAGNEVISYIPQLSEETTGDSAQSPARESASGTENTDNALQPLAPEEMNGSRESTPHTPALSETEAIAPLSEDMTKPRDNTDLHSAPAPEPEARDDGNDYAPQAVSEETADLWDDTSWSAPESDQNDYYGQDETIGSWEGTDFSQTPEETIRADDNIIQKLISQKREMTIADIIFYTLTVLMALFLIKGLLD